jgi:MFS family permease
VDTEDKMYLDNWYKQMNLLCVEQQKLTLFMSMFFYGFATGAILFPLPDKLGKKKAMTILMGLFVVFSGLSVFADTLLLKSVGLFFQGFLHVKITLSYAHMFDLTDQESKPFCSFVLNIFDIASVAFQGLMY